MGDKAVSISSTKLLPAKETSRNTWKTVLNEKSKAINISFISIDGKNISVSADIAESMNNFFCTIEETLGDKIPTAKNPLLEIYHDVNPQKTKFKFIDCPTVR